MTGTTSLESRACGCLAGLAVGDALGRPAEGLSPAEIVERWGRIEGYVDDLPSGSDDTEYALLTATALLRHPGAFTADNIADLWRDEIVHQEGSFNTGGFSEMSAVHNLAIGLRPPRSGQHSHAWSDGLAMRIAPVGIVCAGDPELAAAYAREDGMVSHSEEGIYCGQAVAVAVAVAMGGGSSTEAHAEAMRHIPSDSWTWHNLALAATIVAEEADWPATAERAVAEIAVHDYYWADLAPEAVPLAFAAYLGGAGEFTTSVLNAVNIGRDADTIAAMAGALAGAASGIEAVPEDWLGSVQEAPGVCLRVTKGMHPLAIADNLVALGRDQGTVKVR